MSSARSGGASLRLRASAGERDAATEALRRADTEIARLVRALDALRMDHDDALRRLAHERGLRGELGMLARGQDPNGIVGDDSAFLDAPSVLATRRAMDALFDATTAAVALAKDAAEDARMGSDESVARDKLGETLRACHDALLVMADEDENAARWRGPSANAPPSGRRSRRRRAARRAERRDRDGRRDAARAAKGAGGEGGAHRGSAGRARGAPRRGGREQARGRLRRENERVPRRKRRRARDAIRQTQQGEEDSGGESSRHADEGYRGDERGYREHDEPIGKGRWPR